jgi:hypothetical protein
MTKPKWRTRAWDIHQRYIKQANKKNLLTSEAEVVN